MKRINRKTKRKKIRNTLLVGGVVICLCIVIFPTVFGADNANEDKGMQDVPGITQGKDPEGTSSKTPSETPEETSGETPAESPTENPATSPTQTPAKTPAASKAETPTAAPVQTQAKTPAKTASPTGQDEKVNQPAKNGSEAWMLTLVNAKNPLPDNHSPKLKSLSNGLQFDERAIDQLNAMLSAARAQGLSPVVCSAYRSIEKQRTLFNAQVDKQMAKGLSREQADAETRTVIAYPGTSEHNLGLAADIVSLSYQLLDAKQADTPEIKWLHEHCSEYGFILRYPKDKTEITGIIYESWHFRYVGVEAAKEIMKKGICLEEYTGS